MLQLKGQTHMWRRGWDGATQRMRAFFCGGVKTGRGGIIPKFGLAETQVKNPILSRVDPMNVLVQ